MFFDEENTNEAGSDSVESGINTGHQEAATEGSEESTSAETSESSEDNA